MLGNVKKLNENVKLQILVVAVGVLLLLSKFVAFFLTNSNAILTDALESIINVVAGGFSLYSLILSARPRDENHPYGHGKIEFIAATLEGSLILVAGCIIIFKSIYNLIEPVALQQLDIGILLIAASGEVHEVCVYFNGVLLRGNRTTKRSSDQLLAFDSPNCPHLAEAGITIQYNRSILLPPAEGEFIFHPFKEVPVGVIKVFPGIQFEIFEHIMTDRLKGVVLETFGAGNIPSSGNYLLHIIEKAYNSGTIITVCSQCMQGTVTLGQYATSKALHDIGAVNGKDMTTEAALTKLYYLFSLGIDKDEIKILMSKNLRGELNE